MGNDDQRRAIGIVTSVSADRFIIEMHRTTDNFTIVGFDDIHYVAQLGSFLLIPTQSEYVVVEIVGLRDKEGFSTNINGGYMEAINSAKFLDVVPVGMLPMDSEEKFSFGVSTFPSLFADALYILDPELDRIFDTKDSIISSIRYEDNPLCSNDTTCFKNLGIGKSIIFENYEVKVRIDDFFGGHIAILGNTGSGKSCTIASLIQEIFNKPDEFFARGATFIVFDVNGEYKKAFEKLPEHIGVKNFIVDGLNADDQFRIPHWFLDISEWEMLLQTSERTQSPILRRALGLTTLLNGGDEFESYLNHILATAIKHILGDETPPGAKETRIRGILKNFCTKSINTEQLNEEIKTQYGKMDKVETVFNKIEPFIKQDLEFPDYEGKPFDFDVLEKAIDLALLYEEAHGNRQIRDYCSQMLTRFKALKTRPDYKFLRHKASDDTKNKFDFIINLLGLKISELVDLNLEDPESKDKISYQKENQIVIIDMNAVEDEIVELVSSTLTRMIFSLLRGSDPRNHFPVHLLLEEAHRYISSKTSRYIMNASQIFERVAKEGRKYGFFLLVSSQRPSELSMTVLSQCSNFIVHRIQNPEDLLHIRQMTPFISDSVLRRLPSLPKQHALIFGNSVNLPTTFKVRPASPLPASDDAKIVDLWFQDADRPSQLKIPN